MFFIKAAYTPCLLHDPPFGAKLRFGGGLGDAMEHFFYVNVQIPLSEQESVWNDATNAR